MPSVYIVDDDEAVRASLYALLSTFDNTIIRSFPSGDAFLEELDSLSPGPVLLDMHMPGSGGMEVLQRISGRPEFVTIVLTGKGDIQLAVQAMKEGAFEFLEKPYQPEKLLRTIEIAYSQLDQDMEASARVEGARAKLSRLSARERDVLEGLIEGKSNKIIGYDLDISPRTVEVYRANMMEKLEVQSFAEALQIAFAGGLVEN